MTTKILYSITEWLLRILKSRGVNISKLNPKTRTELEFDMYSNSLID
jgi:hypothetical protein